jgi:hypothetical protein
MVSSQIISAGNREASLYTGNGEAVPEQAANESGAGRQTRLRTLAGKRMRTLLFYLLVLAALSVGWQKRGQVYLTPEQGAGYLLGIIGAVLMLLLLLYPLRKHARWMRGLGAVRHWFRAHMMMGVIGPVCILYHSNFQLGSMNGNIALFSMLLVASSGLVGRYFYTRIHYGLYGRKADLVHLGSDAATAKSHMDLAFEIVPDLQERLGKLEAFATSVGVLAGMVHVPHVWVRTRWCGVASGLSLRHSLRSAAQRNNWTAEQRRYYYRSSRYWLRSYLETLRRVAGFTFYERLFSLWHVLHLPLFLMLLISGIIHVYAVHLY